MLLDGFEARVVAPKRAIGDQIGWPLIQINYKREIETPWALSATVRIGFRVTYRRQGRRFAASFGHYRNNHNGTFSDLQAGLPGVYSGTAAAGDFDNDGRLDVALMGSSGSPCALPSLIARL